MSRGSRKPDVYKREFKREKMANIQNLKPIKTHEEAVSKGRQGGLARSKIKTWQKVKKCTSKCPFYCLCPFVTATIQGDGLCVLKKKKVMTNGREVPIREELIISFFSLFEYGKQGLLNEALSATYKIRLRNQNASNDELYNYVHILIDLKKAFYPEKDELPATNIETNYQKPEFITRLEAERRLIAQQQEE